MRNRVTKENMRHPLAWRAPPSKERESERTRARERSRGRAREREQETESGAHLCARACLSIGAQTSRGMHAPPHIPCTDTPELVARLRTHEADAMADAHLVRRSFQVLPADASLAPMGGEEDGGRRG